MQVYFNGRILPKNQVCISPDDRGFLFGDGIYEVIRSYNGKLFRADDHLKRFKNNLAEVRIKGIENVDFKNIAVDLLKRNKLDETDARVYIQVTRGVAERTHSFPTADVKPTVYITASKINPPKEKWEKGVKVITSDDLRRRRCDIKTTSLQPSILENQKAKESGAEEIIFISDGYITEGSHTTFCAVFDKEIWTHPADEKILPGITRIVIAELCKKLEIPFLEKSFSLDDIKNADELIILGSTTEVMPVIQVNNWKVKSGKPGPITRKLQKAFSDLVKGKN